MKEKTIKIIATPFIILFSPIALLVMVIMGKEWLQAKLVGMLVKLNAIQFELEEKTPKKVKFRIGTNSEQRYLAWLTNQNIPSFSKLKLPWYSYLTKRSARGHGIGSGGKGSNKKYIK